MRNIKSNEKMFDLQFNSRGADFLLRDFSKADPLDLGQAIYNAAMDPLNRDGEGDDFGFYAEVHLYGDSSSNLSWKQYHDGERNACEYELKLRPVNREACVMLTDSGRVKLTNWEFTSRDGKRQIMDLTLHPKDGSAHVKNVRICKGKPRKEAKRIRVALDRPRMAV
jgi:hypothetical protein